MLRATILLCALGLASASSAAPPHWTTGQARRLVAWLDAAQAEGLPSQAANATEVLRAANANNQAALDAVADRAATGLLLALRYGYSSAAARSRWRIAAPRFEQDSARAIDTALSEDEGLDRMFAEARPVHPNYLALRNALATETDPARRRMLTINLERWRWMPRDPGRRYILVNIPAFEATLWEAARPVARWTVIVGKPKSPTPVFDATISGIILNPWWDIPADITAEGIAKLVRYHPGEAAARGYVVENGRYHQRPGPSNALGAMKLVMQNPYKVYLHDTPAKALFAHDVRAFSHGCVRVKEPLGLAAWLLLRTPPWSRAALDQAAASGTTRTIALDAPVRIYLTYFTAESDLASKIRYFADIYHRDAEMDGVNEPQSPTGGVRR